MTTKLITLFSNFYRIQNNIMTIEKYNKLLLLYKGIIQSTEVYINQAEWDKMYKLNTSVLPQSTPIKRNILNSIKELLKVQYLQLIQNFYTFLDNTQNLKNLSENVKEELKFIIFSLSKKNTNFVINENIWKSIRTKCLVQRRKTKMPREPVSLSDIVISINNILSLNN